LTHQANTIYFFALSSFSVTVRLVKTTGVVAASRQTDKNGKFLFIGKEPGEYYVSVVAPEGYHFSPQSDSVREYHYHHWSY